MTLEGPDGKRYLVYKDGSLVTESPIRIDDLDPASRQIVDAFIAIGKKRQERGPGPREPHGRTTRRTT